MGEGNQTSPILKKTKLGKTKRGQNGSRRSKLKENGKVGTQMTLPLLGEEVKGSQTNPTFSLRKEIQCSSIQQLLKENLRRKALEELIPEGRQI